MNIIETIPLYLNHLKTLGRSNATLKGRRYDLKKFTRFLDQERINTLEDLSADIMTLYQQELCFSLTAKNKPLTLRSQAQLMGVAKGFTKFLKEQDYLLHDPGEDIKVPKKPKRLPKVILKPEEIKDLINAPNMRTHSGFRDRIILEILYDTAIRSAELSGIKINDLDLDGGFIHIRGKGNKDRVVPLSQRVCELTRNYILSVRPVFLRNTDSGHLILNRWGQKMDGNGIWNVIKRCSKAANIKRNGTVHTIRHTCATHMLKNGAPVRHLQEMLGHESLESTQIYTHVTITDLKEVHAKYHPGETME